MSTHYVIDGNTVTKVVEEKGVGKTEKSVELDTFLGSLSSSFYLDTGILPPGILSVRQFGTKRQIVIQLPPGLTRTLWAKYEGSADKPWLLAMPFRIILAMFENNKLLGCRMFFSPTQVTSLTDTLYHTSLPNTNCRGYGLRGGGNSFGNGLGWVCLYHTNDGIAYGDNIAAQAQYATMRCAGGEQFNDANMSLTDGTRFYQEAKKPSYIWSPTAWQKKSAEEGFAWTLDPDLLIPALVTDANTQSKHDPNGVPLSLGMAMYGDATYYYRTPLHDELTLLQREGSTKTHENLNLSRLVDRAFNKTLQTPVKRVDPVKLAAQPRTVTPEAKATAKKASPAKKAAAKKAPAKKATTA